ncbi:patatin-like phospholipase family protein [Dasania marina]|uniref:patatin-like phospholipase family protein n=1 Tax=Dasania marina TaxID=471499 RepID=UPI0030DC123A
MPNPINTKQTALLMPGGGARAAYQVGVIKALATIIPTSQSRDPFPILCGTSAGALNAIGLASRTDGFVNASVWLENLWMELSHQHVYRSDLLGLSFNAWRLILSLFNAGIAVGRPVALLDNAPLRKLLKRKINFAGISENIQQGNITAACVTAMNYTEGSSDSFFQGGPANSEWRRWRRKGIPTPLQLPHLMASSAIPTLFPPQRIRRNYYGDGALRQMNPISPALHLGADKILIISTTGHKKIYDAPPRRVQSPAFGQILGHLLNSAFVDSLENDIENLETINRLVDSCADARGYDSEQRLRRVEPFIISPSQDIDAIATEHINELPATVRFFLKMTGSGRNDGGVNIASYLLFTESFSRELIKMGVKDTLDQADKILKFLKD